MIYIGIGANLPSKHFNDPRATCEAALRLLDAYATLNVMECSRWYTSAPVPASDQAWFVNAVARLETDLPPRALLNVLHEVENAFGRVRSRRNAPRILDLDLLAYDDLIMNAREEGVDLPHSRMAERAFVLLPLADIAPNWRHHVLGLPLKDLIAHLPQDQICYVYTEP